MIIKPKQVYSAKVDMVVESQGVPFCVIEGTKVEITKLYKNGYVECLELGNNFTFEMSDMGLQKMCKLEVLSTLKRLQYES